jgi:hypothetical protein
VPINVDVRDSPGWWMKREFDRLNDRERRTRLWKLHNYYRGEPPLPQGADAARESYAAFVKHARSNFAKLIVAALTERMSPVGFRTSADDDVTGDAEAAAVWERAGMVVVAADTHNKMGAMSESYVIVGEVDEETGAPTITAEDPRTMVGEPDPVNPNRLIAVLKVLHDDAAEETRAYLYLPAVLSGGGRSRVFVARRQSRTSIVPDLTWCPRPGQLVAPTIPFDPRGWEWHPDLGGEQGQELLHDRMPVVRFLNEDGAGEFEPHLPILDRINHQILQRMVIATMQAFRQRAVRGLPLRDENGKEIDYSDVFTMDPAALWQLPATAEMWESGQIDLRPILSAVEADVQHLAAVTRTPMHMLMPSGVNQSAEGASMQREGLVFKTKDRLARTGHPWARVMSLAFLQLGKPEKADLATLQTLWAPAERLSLSERADAATKAVNDIPRRSRLIEIWGFTPTQADRMMTEWADDQLLAAQIAQATAANQQQQQPAQQPVPPAPDPLAGQSLGDIAAAPAPQPVALPAPASV